MNGSFLCFGQAQLKTAEPQSRSCLLKQQAAVKDDLLPNYSINRRIGAVRNRNSRFLVGTKFLRESVCGFCHAIRTDTDTQLFHLYQLLAFFGIFFREEPTPESRLLEKGTDRFMQNYTAIGRQQQRFA